MFKRLHMIILMVVILFLILMNLNDKRMLRQIIKDQEDQLFECLPKKIECSKFLNAAMRNIGRLTCEKSWIGVSQNGGWCSKISSPDSKQHATDKNLAIELSKLLSGKTVASFGDGPGIYKKLILDMNEVKSYSAFDGAPYVEETTDNQVQFLDLSVPIYHLPEYDWVISLEVAEHIPREFESIYVDNVVQHAKEGIVLSWAPEGQDGHSHVNNRNFDYVKKIIEAKGFQHSEKISQHLKEKSTLPWLKLNINVFLRNHYNELKKN